MMNKSEQTDIIEETAAAVKKKDEGEEESPILLVINFIITFLLAVFAIIAIGLVALKIFGFSVYSVKTASMEPAYPVNSIVFVQKTEPASIQVGDTITYALNEDGDTVTHRVIAVDQQKHTFTTKGDNNNVQDANPVSWDNTIGKVVFSLPTGGQVFQFISAEENRPMMIAIIVCLLGVTVVWEVIDQVRKRKKRKNIQEQV